MVSSLTNCTVLPLIVVIANGNNDWHEINPHIKWLAPANWLRYDNCITSAKLANFNYD